MTTRHCRTSRLPEKTSWKNTPLQSKAFGAISHGITSEGFIGPRRVTLKQTLCGLLLRPVRGGALQKTILQLGHAAPWKIQRPSPERSSNSTTTRTLLCGGRTTLSTLHRDTRWMAGRRRSARERNRCTTHVGVSWCSALCVPHCARPHHLKLLCGCVVCVWYSCVRALCCFTCQGRCAVRLFYSAPLRRPHNPVYSAQRHTVDGGGGGG